MLLKGLLVALLASVCLSQSPKCEFNGLREIHYSGDNFDGNVIHRTFGIPEKNMGFQSGFPGGPNNNFAIRWDGLITFPAAGRYVFRIGSDDGYRLYINGVKQCEAWRTRGFTFSNDNCPSNLYSEGQILPIVVEYYEVQESARISIQWEFNGQPRVSIPASQFSWNNCTKPKFESNLVLTPGKLGIQAQVTLTAQPTEPVTVSFQSSCASFDRCTVTFTSSNWDTPLPISVFLLPRETCCNVTAKVTSGDMVFLNQFDQILVCAPQKEKGISWGDPHYFTADKVRFDYFGLGDFFNIRSLDGRLIAQSRLIPCGRASCNSAFAIRYETVTFYIYNNQGSLAINSVGDPDQIGADVEWNNNVASISFLDGSLVQIGVTYLPKLGFYTMSLRLMVDSSFHRRIAGLVGFFDGKPENDFMSPTGVILGNAIAFSESWAVPQSENLFLDAKAHIAPIMTSSSSSFPVPCVLPPPGPNSIKELLKNTSRSESPLKDEPPPVNPDKYPDCTVFPSADFLAEAKASCEPPLSGPVAECCENQGVSRKDFIETCLCDYNLADGPDFTVDTVKAFYQSCEAVTSQLGVSCKACPDNCNGNGVCKEGSCDCKDGFQGKSCNEDWNQPPRIISIKPGQLKAKCPDSSSNQIVILGSSFYGNDLKCKFDDVMVPATRVTEFQLICTIPFIPQQPSKVTVSVSRGGQPSSSTTLDFVASCCTLPCSNSGICLDGNGFTCDCTGTGFAGPTCETPFDDCASGPCKNDGKCSDLHKGFTCDCAGTGFAGSTCETPFDDCASSPCKNDGKCSDLHKGFTCDCAGTGFAGSTCEAPFDDCASSPCKNGKCSDLHKGFTCDCTGTGFLGTICDKPDPCFQKPCKNGGVCTPKDQEFSCDCSGLDFDGPTCEKSTKCPSVAWNGGIIPDASNGDIKTFVCPPGSAPLVKRLCRSGSFTETYVACEKLNTCPSESSATASWPKSFSGLTYGICAKGYSGEPSRICDPDGAWDSSITNPCKRNVCPAVSEKFSSWTVTDSMTMATGICTGGYHGTPTRECQDDGKWGNIMNPCVAPVFCQVNSLDNAFFPLTSGGEIASGVCAQGYIGSPTRQCRSDGTWGSISQPCVLRTCAAVQEANATWSSTLAFSRAFGTCTNGKGGQVFRDCLSSGTFGPIYGSCLFCPAENYGRVDWPDTPADVTVSGDCIPGWTGTPKRECGSDGIWKLHLSSFCNRLYCNAVNDGVHSFQRMEAGSQAYGVCVKGTGRPWRKCNLNGTFGPIQSPCKI